MHQNKTIYILFVLAGLFFAACAPQPSPEPAQPAGGEPNLVGPIWKWTGFTDPLQKIEIEQPDLYTVQFNDDGTINFRADCNNGGGEYSLDGTSIQIEVGRMTMMACDPDSRSDEFLKHMSAAAIFFFQGDELYIDLKYDSGTMRFHQ